MNRPAHKQLTRGLGFKPRANFFGTSQPTYQKRIPSPPPSGKTDFQDPPALRQKRTWRGRVLIPPPKAEAMCIRRPLAEPCAVEF